MLTYADVSQPLRPSLLLLLSIRLHTAAHVSIRQHTSSLALLMPILPPPLRLVCQLDLLVHHLNLAPLLRHPESSLLQRVRRSILISPCRASGVVRVSDPHKLVRVSDPHKLVRVSDPSRISFARN